MINHKTYGYKMRSLCVFMSIMIMISAIPNPMRSIDRFYEQAIVTNERYPNHEVAWGRPKCRYCGDLVGAGEEQKTNLYPDVTSTYFVANIKLELGWKLIIKGQYPHARYISYTVANQLGDDQIGSGTFLRGDQIIPDPGSVNPYLANVPRDSSNRNYTIYVVQSDSVPQVSSNNTLYTTTERTHLSIRIYLVDFGYDGTGLPYNGLPTITLSNSFTNQTVQGKALLKLLDVRKTGDPNGYQLDQWLEEIKSSNDQLNAPISPIPKAELFLNTAYSVSGLFIDDPIERLYMYPPDTSGGFANNPDTEYLILPYSFGYGELLVVQGLKPTHPYTTGRVEYMNTTTQVQYFSISTGAGPCSGEGWETVYDEELPDYYTIVVSWPWNRPSNAVKNNGIVWLSPNVGEGHYVTARSWVGVLYIRYQNCNPNWLESPANIPIPSRKDPILRTQEVMGEYYPRSMYMSKAEFESLY